MSYKIGASEIAGLIKHYALNGKLGDKSEEIYNKINVDYLPSFYEHSCLYRFTTQEKELYDLYRKANKTRAMTIGNEMEELVKEDYLQHNDRYSHTRNSQIQLQKTILDNVLYYRATIDYLLHHSKFCGEGYCLNNDYEKYYLLECKTTNPFTYSQLSDEPPFHYWIQVQMQMYIHEIYEAVIHIAGIKQEDDKSIIYDSRSYSIKYDKDFVDNVIVKTGSLFIDDMANNIQYDITKTKRDIELDCFLEMLKNKDIVVIDKCELPINEFCTLKEHYKIYSNLEKQIKSSMKDMDQSMIFIREGDKTLLCKRSKVNYHTQETIDKTIQDLQKKLSEAQKIQVGDKIREASMLISIL